MSDPISVKYWAKGATGWEWAGDIDTWNSLDLSPRFNAPGVFTLGLPIDEQSASLTDEHVLTFDFRGYRETCLIEDFGVSRGPEGRPQLDVLGMTATTLFGDALVWPDPASAVTAQNVVRYTASGAAETVLRNLVLDNLPRIGYEVVVPASLGRGSNVQVNEEFTNLLDVMQRKAAKGGVGFRIGLVDSSSNTRANMTVEFFVPTDESTWVTLSHEDGTMGSWTSRRTIPTATRVVVGAAREETTLTVGTVNATNNTFTISGKNNARHHLRTGDLIRFSGKGTPPAPLEDRQAYFTIRVDANTFKVAQTRRKASAGNAIDLTDVGTAPLKFTETVRIFRYVTNSAAESRFRRYRETFLSVSAEDDDLDDPYVAAGEEALLEAAAKVSFELEAVEAEGMRYIDHVKLGDLVRVAPVQGVSTVEQLGGVNITSSQDGGVRVAFIPGDPNAADPMFGQAKLIRGVRSRIAAIEREES